MQRLHGTTPSLSPGAQPPATIADNPADAFIESIDDQLQAGYGIVPIIGAGLSAPSGTPLVWDLRPYLHHCIWLALGCDALGKRPWNPRTDQWPPFTDGQRHVETELWEQIRYRLGEKQRTEQWTEAAIFQEALGAMAEWRTALLFLSRVVCEPYRSRGRRLFLLALDAPNQDVIDGCLRHTMRGRSPTLGHRMLATLATSLRLNVMLTTNFDDLLEQAFEAARNPLEVSDVHLGDDLPPYSAVAGRRALVKMHGNLYSLRVDYTLDALPTATDRRRFLEYICSTTLSFDHHIPRSASEYERPRNHLLVIGVSASERRTRDFISYVWEHLEPSFKVYWVCHSERSVKTVEEFVNDFRESHAKDDRSRLSDWPGIHVVHYPQTGLLLLQLYQTLRHGIPSTGIIFPSASRLSIPPLPRNPRISAPDLGYHNTFVRTLLSRIEQVQDPSYHQHRLVVVTSEPKNTGVISACASAFDRIENERQVAIWLDMNDISSTDDLFEQLLDAVCYRVGMENWMPVYVEKRARPRALEIRNVAASVNTKWVIFLNARETPGTNFAEGTEVINDSRHPNNWLDASEDEAFEARQRIKDDDSNTRTKFLEFIATLCAPVSCAEPSPLSVVLLCRRSPLGMSPLESAITEVHQLASEAVCPEHSCAAFDEDIVLSDTIEWLTAGPAELEFRRQFLHALLLLQRTRYLATVWSTKWFEQLQVNHVATPQIGPKTPLEWLKALERFGLVRQKPGRFIWLHARTRTRLREIFISGHERTEFLDKLKSRCNSRKLELRELQKQIRTAEKDYSETPGKLYQLLETKKKELECETGRLAAVRKAFKKCFGSWDPRITMPSVHWQLALWYRRVMEASRMPAAVFEAVYHACRAAEALLLKPQFEAHDLQTAIERIQWSSSLLRANSFLIQTQGYSRGSCRRLGHIREERCDAIDSRAIVLTANAATQRTAGALTEKLKDAVQALRVRCTEVMRAIAREVGEDFRSYERQKEVRTLLAGQQLDAPASTNQLRSAFADGSPDAAMEWVRWWRWNGMLGIASRSYGAARSALHRSILAVSNPDILVEDGGLPLHEAWSSSNLDHALEYVVEKCRQGEGKLLNFETAPNQQQLRLEMARVIEQLANLALLESSLARKVGVPAEIETDRGLKRLISTGLDLVEQILSNDQSADSHDAGSALWCRTRFLMHRGIWEARKDRTRVPEALRDLGDADACLPDSYRRGVDSAVIELYRAEVRMLQADSVGIPCMKDGQLHEVNFEDFPSLFEQNSTHLGSQGFDATSVLWRPRSDELLEKLFPKDREIPKARNGRLRTARSYVEDAITFLTRAESILLTGRRSVWWTTWFFHRRMRTIAMSIWATVCERESPIPVVGLEEAPRGTPTLADSLLENSLRMIRVDSYRLATIIREYASCAHAYHTRLVLDHSAEDERSHCRQLTMRANLIRALERLELVSDLRNEGQRDDAAKSQETPRQKSNKAVDTRITKYLNDVQEYARRVAASIQFPLS